MTINVTGSKPTKVEAVSELLKQPATTGPDEGGRHDAGRSARELAASRCIDRDDRHQPRGRPRHDPGRRSTEPDRLPVGGRQGQ